MKCVVLLFAIIAAASAAFPPFSGSSFAPKRPFSSPAGRGTIVQPPPVKRTYPQSASHVGDARSASVVKYDNEVNPDGSYNYYFETDNGIAAQAQGTPRDFGGNPPVVPVVAQGSFSWVAPDGQNVAISYVADENGYQPTGDSIPTPPPVPPQIARALDYIARNAPRQ